MAQYVGVEHSVAVSSGTAGLHLAVLAAGIGSGDLVITTPFSFVASSNCVLFAGAEPLFVDVDPVTGNIDPARVAVVLEEYDREAGSAGDVPDMRRRRRRPAGRIKAILPVHVFGQPADMDALHDLAGDHELVVIEDACEALGAEYKTRRAGSLGDVAVFGFYPNKQLTTGEGGMVVTSRDDWADRMLSQRNQGRDRMDEWLRHDRLGYNYRLDELSAALGVAQLSRFEQLLATRNRVATWYEERLASIPLVEVPRLVPTTSRMSWFAYVVRLDRRLDRERIMRELAGRGIPSRPYFTPIHLQPFYRRRFGFRPGDYPVAEALGASCLALPFSGIMSEQQVERVCQALAELTGSEGRQSPATVAAV
jgi:dTDP-4-amino-4,6-dideoxygalactose transaminase